MKEFAIIGYPLTHSFSPIYFNEKFKKLNLIEYIYNKYPLTSIEEFPDLIKNNNNLIGLNVTIPYKEQVIKYLDILDETARSIGAVNTIKITRQDEKVILKGFNTDAYGFMNSFKPLLKEYHKKALILGTGGASKAVVYVLKNLNIDFLFVSRKPKAENHISYNDLFNKKILSDYLIVINTTPLGMYPDSNTKPEIPYDQITEYHYLYDLIYNPDETLFLKEGKKRNATIKNGLEMLYLQAEKAWEIWNDNSI